MRITIDDSYKKTIFETDFDTLKQTVQIEKDSLGKYPQL